MDNAATNKKLGREQQDQEVSFTELETECILQFLQNKKTPVHISEDLGVSQSTVRFCFMNAGQKLVLIGKNKL